MNFRATDGVQGLVANLDVAGNGSDILLDMSSGRSMVLQSDQRFVFPLTDARDHISRALDRCPTHRYARLESFSDLVRTVEEKSAPDKDTTRLVYMNRTDSIGHDLRTGRTDAGLRGIVETDCIAACIADRDCALAAYNESTRICSLKSTFGSLTENTNVTTTYVQHRPAIPPAPLIPGPPVVRIEQLRAVAGEPAGAYKNRLRTASTGLGGDCRAEADAAQHVISGLRLDVPERQAQAGGKVALSWAVGLMSERVPLWLVVAVDRPARFAGTGFFGLNAGAMGPFGLQQDEEFQRAFVPLFEGEHVQNGKLDLIPLEAGSYTIRITALAYLRRCQHELPLGQSEFQLTVAPAAPEVVLRDFTDVNPFDRRTDVPEFNRRIDLSDTRFQIRNLSDGSEVLSREGKNLALSPTKRFVVIHDNAKYEIIDLVDGETLAQVDGESLAFWNADSFFISQASSMGEIGLGQTMRPSVFVNQYRTGPACCANRGMSHVSVSVENSLVRIADPIWSESTAAWSLLDGTRMGAGDVVSYVPERKHLISKSFGRDVLRTVGMVAPLDISEKWDMPLGPLFVHGHGVTYSNDVEDAEERAIFDMARTGVQTVPIAKSGFAPFQTVSASTIPAVLRGMSPASTVRQAVGFQSALRRTGLDLADAQQPVTWLDKPVQTPLRPDTEPDPEFAATISKVEQDLARIGLKANWAKHNFDKGVASYCEHLPSPGDVTTPLLAAYELELAQRFDILDRVIWVLRARCDGGATASSVNHRTIVSVFDNQAPGTALGSYAVEEGGSFGGSRKPSILDAGYTSKIFGEKLLVFFAPGEGALMVYDLTGREFLMQLDYSDRGDLMSDVFVDASLQHLIQLNSEGSLAVYRLADGDLILRGRYLDDELVFWTDDFQFDATEEGAAFVELRFPGRAGQFSLQQFDDALRVPGLLQRVLAGETIPQAAAFPGIPPEITGILNADDGKIHGIANVITKGSAVAVRLFQDGVLTDSFVPDDEGQIVMSSVRKKGARWASLVAEDHNGLVSLPVNTDLGADPGGLADTFFLGVGIDYYKDDRLEDLNYAKVDALRLSDTFSALSGRTISLVENAILTDRRAGREEILAQINRITGSAKPGDHVVMFFAGHGLTDDDGVFYLGLSGTDLDDLPGTALRWSEIAEQVADTGVRITVLLDACHSGAAASGAFATNDSAVEDLTGSLSGTVTILAAAKGRQFSGESPDAGGGYFTGAISKVLGDKRALFDQNANGVLEVTELYRGVKHLVVAQRGRHQTPWLSRNKLVGEHGLF
ncbi:caspase family protein [Roseobacter ponti]|uniref:Peptidase C14 caspase domain-containing protein n=1 Tax=Roseobacter ponti TaxID=1891787 RepID=A0A858SV17_9RHOB|nr:caspase family protein [Roseobacter ponti]QJF51847.1 hypothetical protein G3256_12075 [Roseobacter ponti]